MNTVKKILGDELYYRVLEKLGNDNGLIIDDGMLIPKHRFDCINLSLKDHKKIVAELREENARMKADIARLYESERKIAKLNAERNILELVLESKPKNYLAVMSLLNIDGLTEKNMVKSVKKQLSAIKTAEPYMFHDTELIYRLVPIGKKSSTELHYE